MNRSLLHCNIQRPDKALWDAEELGDKRHDGDCAAGWLTVE